MPFHFSFKACIRLHLFDSELKKECWVQLKLSVRQSSKCVGRILFFNSFFLISSAPCPMKTTKQSRYFCVLKYAGQAIKKKRSRAKLNTEGETEEKS